MKNFILGVMFGSFIAAIVAWVTAERIAYYKSEAISKAKKIKSPTVGVYKWQGKIVVPPKEANYISEKETIYQYPRSAEFESSSGVKIDDVYKQCFKKYVINLKLTNPEAWKMFQKDYPNLLPRKDTKDKVLQTRNIRKAFYEAMSRQRRKLKEKK